MEEAQRNRAAKGFAPKGLIVDTTLSEYNYRVANMADDEKRILINKLRRKHRKQHDE